MKTDLRIKYIKALNNSRSKGLMSEAEYNKEMKELRKKEIVPVSFSKQVIKTIRKFI